MKKYLTLALIILMIAPAIMGCGKKDTHWGQRLDQDEKWWKKEGQSWDRKTNVFMTIGYSNPDWVDKEDLRKSADLDARSQVASFMNSLIKNYMEEIRSNDFKISERSVKSTANETVIGSVVTDRHYIDKKKQKQYLSLIKVDLNYFFDNVYKKYQSDVSSQTRADNADLESDELDRLIKGKIDDAMDDLKKIEEPVIEKTIKGE